MKRPTPNEVLFSVKCFVAGMLTLYLAFRLGLARPFWGLMTSYIVASPLSGSVRSKAVYRVIGTVVGSAFAVFVVPALENAPELLALGLACWVGGCLYISLLDRTPRSYVFMLAGYTAALIGFPVVSAPGTVFDVAIARVEEITLGITCATLIHSLVFPSSIGSALLDRLDKALHDGRRWIADVTRNIQADHDQHARQTLAGDITELRLMSTHLPFDTSHLRWTSATIHLLQDQLALLLPTLSAVEDRLIALRELDPGFLTPQWGRVFAEIADWSMQADKMGQGRLAQLRQSLNDIMPALGPQASWSDMLQMNLAARLLSLVDAHEESIRLRRRAGEIALGAALPEDKLNPPSALQGLHVDHGLALMSAFAAVIAICACCLFWIATAWSSGSAAAMMAAVFCCFFATQDDPAPSIRTFSLYTLWSMPISAFYLLVVMPAIHGFEMLALTLAPAFILLGCFIARPASGLRAMATLIGVFGMLTLQDTGNADMASFLNSMLAQFIGMGSALIFTGLLRSVSGEWTARRLLHKGWAELAAMGMSSRDAKRNESSAAVPFVAARMLDRIALLTPRLAAGNGRTGQSAVNALGDLRIALGMAQLLDMEARLAGAGISIRPLMALLSEHFRSLEENGRQVTAHLLASIDTALRGICHSTGGAELKRAVICLTSLRRDLFPAAPPFLQQPAQAEVAA
jgi:uncharacterized membrane protein YccC